MAKINNKQDAFNDVPTYPINSSVYNLVHGFFN